MFGLPETIKIFDSASFEQLNFLFDFLNGFQN